MQPTKEIVLVAGATGYVGGRLVPALLKNDYNIRCLARTPEKLNARNWPEIQVMKADVMDYDSLLPAMSAVTVAYYLVHSMTGTGNFESLDLQAAQNFGRAAAVCKVKRIIYLGGLGREQEQLSPHLRNRQQVGQVLAAAGVPVTELRASIIIGSGSASFEIIRDLVRKLPIMITPRWVNSRAEPIAIQNVIEYLIGCLTQAKTMGQVLEIGGGEILTYADMMRQVARVMNKKLSIWTVPVLTPRLSAYWLNLVTSVPMSLAYPLVEGLRNDTICTDQRIREWLPIALIPFEQAVRTALTSDAEGKMESRWTEANIASSELKVPKSFHFQDLRALISRRPAAQIFLNVERIGGQTGWYYANWAWKLRGALDRLVGGVGMRRGRRHPSEIRVGDAIDFWRVEAFVPGARLKLRAEMKLPGVAYLEFRVETSTTHQTRFEQIATFFPRSWPGRIYWYLTTPLHFFIFRNMAKRIVSR